jgi:hypothetical protein
MMQIPSANNVKASLRLSSSYLILDSAVISSGTRIPRTRMNLGAYCLSCPDLLRD